MGLTESSTRKLTVPNETPFLKITDDLIERIMACQEKKVKDDKPADKKREDCKPTEVENTVRDTHDIPPDRLKYSGDALINYYYGPSVTSLQILQAKEKELKENEVYWMQRIQKLEDHHGKLKEIMEEKYDQAINEINSQVPRPPPGTPFPCVEEKNKVLKCYNQHPKEALQCAIEVSQFANCIHNKRIVSLQDKKEQAAC